MGDWRWLPAPPPEWILPRRPPVGGVDIYSLARFRQCLDEDVRMSTYTINHQVGLPVPTEEVVPDSERADLLERTVSFKIANGAKLEHRSEFEAVMTSGRKINHILHLLLTIFTLGLWLIIWALMGMFGGESRYTLRVDEHGTVSEVH